MNQNSGADITVRNKNENYSRTKILTLIPVFVLAAAVLCMVLAMILEGPSNRGAVYTVFAFAGLMSIFLSPLPCLILSVIGTVFAVKAVKEGAARAAVFLILGILEMLVYVAGAILAVLIFIGGQGV